MKIEWQDYLATGILEIDIQHKLLFEKYNAFLAACRSEQSSEEAVRLFWFLEAYAVTHFTDEERTMQRLGLDEYLLHREQHQLFAVKVASFRERLKAEGLSPALVLTVTQFVSQWLVEHISKMDRAIGVRARVSAQPAAATDLL